MEPWMIIAGGALLMLLVFKLMAGIIRTVFFLALVGGGIWVYFQYLR